MASESFNDNLVKLPGSEETYQYPTDQSSSPFKDFVIPIYDMKHLLNNELPDLSTGLTISQITFRQDYVPGTPTRSRLYDLKIYNGISALIPSRTKNSVTVQLDFSGKGYDEDDMKLMYYRPTVKMQDIFGNYQSVVVSLFRHPNVTCLDNTS